MVLTVEAQVGMGRAAAVVHTDYKQLVAPVAETEEGQEAGQRDPAAAAADHMGLVQSAEEAHTDQVHHMGLAAVAVQRAPVMLPRRRRRRL